MALRNGTKLPVPVLGFTTDSISLSIPPWAGNTVSLSIVSTNAKIVEKTWPAVPISINYSAPIIYRVSTARGNNVVAPYGEVIAVQGRFFGLPGIGLNVSVTLNATNITTASISHRNDSYILVTVPPYTAIRAIAMSLVLTIEGIAVAPVALRYETPMLGTISPPRAYPTIGPAMQWKNFTLQGSGFGLSSRDIAQAQVGGVNCTSVVWLSPTSVVCAMSKAAIAQLYTSQVLVSLVGMTDVSATLPFELLPLPVINRVVVSKVDGPASIWVDGQGLGYGATTAATTVGTSGNGASILAVSVLDVGTGRSLFYDTLFWSRFLGRGVVCTFSAMASIDLNTSYVMSIGLEDGILVISNGFSFQPAPTILNVAGPLGGSLVAGTGGTITLTCAFCGVGNATLVSNVMLGSGSNASAVPFAGVDSSRVNVSVPSLPGTQLTLPLTVFVGSKSSTVSISYAQLTVLTLSPPSFYQSFLSPSQTFEISGSFPSPVTSAQISNIECAVTCSTPTLVCCRIDASHAPNLTSATVTVTVAGMDAVPASADLFVPIGRAFIQRLVTQTPYDYTAPIFVDGTALGYAAAKTQLVSAVSHASNAPVIQQVGLLEPVNGTFLPCATSAYPRVLGTYIVCFPSVAVEAFTAYRMVVQLEANVTVTSTGVVVFAVVPPKLAVSFVTPDLAAAALPSANGIVFRVWPSVVVLQPAAPAFRRLLPPASFSSLVPTCLSKQQTPSC